jgi:hypothetical protein
LRELGIEARSSGGAGPVEAELARAQKVGIEIR